MSTVRGPYSRGRAVGRASVHAFHRDAPPARDRPSRWHWLLTLAVLVPLATPLYNRLDPRLFGIPFFYWGQLAAVVFAMLVTVLVHEMTKRRP